MDELKQVWDAAEKPVRSRDVDAAWLTIQEEMKKEKPHDDVHSTSSSRSVRERTTHRSAQRSRWQPLLRVTGIVILVTVAALITVLVPEQWAVSWSASESKTFVTDNRERATIRLDDGSEVHLNADSRLVLGEEFDRGPREVRLQGQAYFQVAQDDRPFIVRSKNVAVEALGTTFDVKAYRDEKRTEVTVAEGVVALRREQSTPEDTVMLRAQHLGIASSQGLKTVRGGVDLTRQLAWTRGELVFTDASFHEVVRKLERWYDLRIKVRVASEQVDRLNATFGDEPLSEVIRSVAAALDLQYERDGKRVVFHRTGEAPSRST